MNDRLAKRQPIDLEELDRQLRDPRVALADENEDPLAELARLVNSSPDPFAPMFSKGRDAPHGQTPSVFSGRQADLRPGFDDVGEPWQAKDEHGAQDESDLNVYRDPSELGQGWSQRKKGLWASVALIAVFGGIVTILAVHEHSKSPGAPPTILADARPYKVAGPAQTKQGELSSGTGAADSVQTARIVNTEEQPVDLSLAASNKDETGAQPDSSSFFPPPRQVKSVSVRPDGTIIGSSDSPSDSASTGSGDTTTSPDSPQPQAPLTGAPKTSSADDGQAPAASSPVAPTTPDAAASGAPPQSDGSASSASSDAQPSSPSPSSGDTAAQQPQSSGGSFANLVDQATQPGAPASSAPTASSATDQPVRTADASATPSSTPATSGANTWAVQLAAPGSERDASAASAKLARKYASELGGRGLVTRQAESNGRQVWRVRVAGMSRPEAIDLCTHIKSSGGACFLAHE